MKPDLLIGSFAYLRRLTLGFGLWTLAFGLSPLAFGQATHQLSQPTLEQALNRSVFELLSGRTNAAMNWVYGSVFSPNPRSWVRGVEFSGWAPPTQPSKQERHVVLLTARHGITCNHAFGSGPGTQVVMTGTNGLRYTNGISTTIGGLDDLRMVVFTNDWPAQVTPWAVLPPNYADFVNLSNVMAIWYRQNTGKMNVYSSFWLQGLEARVANPVPGVPFYEPGATGGDSGSPVFFVLNRRPIFAFSVYAGLIQGPFVSNPVCFDWIRTNIAPYKLQTIDIGDFL
jgi:hypothetical protein